MLHLIARLFFMIKSCVSTDWYFGCGHTYGLEFSDKLFIRGCFRLCAPRRPAPMTNYEYLGHLNATGTLQERSSSRGLPFQRTSHRPSTSSPGPEGDNPWLQMRQAISLPSPPHQIGPPSPIEC